jgi:hypothetical protein
MDSRTRERVEDWEEVRCAAGLDGLRDLADRAFSGVVTGTGTSAFVLNGRIVGFDGGTLDALEDVPLTAYEAPDPALPLLFAMQVAGGETQAEYYTNDTPIAEARQTLSDGSFTGYIELSENVLSGDYYLCFYGGRALPVAFIGSSERLLTGEEAFERANDEVGIYEVKAVDIEVTEIPDPEGEEEPADASGVAAGRTSDESAATEADEEAAANEEPAASTADATDDGSASDDPDPDAGSTEPDADPGEGPDGADPGADETAARVDAPGGSGDETSADEVDSETGPAARPDRSTDEQSRDPATDSRRTSHDEDTGIGTVRADEGTDGRAEAPDDGPSSRETTDSPAAPDRDDPNQPSPRREADRAREATESGRSRPDPLEPRPERHEPSAERSDVEGRRDRGADGRQESGEPRRPADDSRFDREEEWRETRRIPSIDPDQSESDDGSGTAPGTGERSSPGRPTAKRPSDARQSGRPDRQPSDEHKRQGTPGDGTERTDRRPERSTSKSSGSRSTASSAPDGSIEKPLEQAMLEREDQIDRLQQRVSDLESKRETLQAERDTLERENESLESENDRLQTRVDELEDEVAALESQIEELEATLEAEATDGTADAGAQSRSMPPGQALSATNLFLRYDSKGQATLEDVHAGDADAEALNANLRLEYHTSFDATNVEVEGTPYEGFLESSIHYEFVDWLLRELPFEIRETGNAKSMDELYDVIPKIDRVECMGTVEIPTGDEEDEDLAREFDVVARDRMGNPLVIANLNDSLDPATENMMVSLQESATAVKEAHDDLGAAFMVTTSFFDPGALEVASEATSGSLLSRDSRKSYVKLSRKRGYHLCLVETREGNFHVNVPEL